MDIAEEAMQTIHAIYENGLFRPTVPVNLPDNTKVELDIRPQPKTAEQTATTEPTLGGLLKYAGALNDLPPDMAAQHDHYIHGTPKR
jgi:predicted DNA-binding antitoxin AbrB/MazE fold protein